MTLIYAGGLTESSFTSGLTTGGWLPWSYLYGADIVVPSSGTATMMGIRCKSENGTSRSLKFGLYTSGGTLVAQATGSVSSTTTAWVDSSSISASVSAGTYYVLVSSSGDASNYAQYAYSSAGNGSYATEAFATAMQASETITGGGDAGQLYAVRLDFTASAAATSYLPSRASRMAQLIAL